MKYNRIRHSCLLLAAVILTPQFAKANPESDWLFRQFWIIQLLRYPINPPVCTGISETFPYLQIHQATSLLQEPYR